MMMTRISRAGWSAALLGALGSGCAREAKPVTFAVTAQADSFGDKAPVRLTIWDAEQLARSEKTANCTVSKDFDTGKEETKCPPGAENTPKATPEERTVTREELQKGVTVASKIVTVGERYRVDLRGPSPDGCNTTSGMAAGVAASDAVQISKIDLSQTEMACRPARP